MDLTLPKETALRWSVFHNILSCVSDHYFEAKSWFSQSSPNKMSEPAILLGSTIDHPILIDDDDHLQQEPERDGSEADTIRIDTPEYEQWSNDNCSAAQPNESLVESTPTFLKYDCTGVSQTPAPLAEEESEKMEDFKQGMLMITCSISGNSLTKTILLRLSRKFSFWIDSGCPLCLICSIQTSFIQPVHQ